MTPHPLRCPSQTRSNPPSAALGAPQQKSVNALLLLPPSSTAPHGLGKATAPSRIETCRKSDRKTRVPLGMYREGPLYRSRTGNEGSKESSSEELSLKTHKDCLLSTRGSSQLWVNFQGRSVGDQPEHLGKRLVWTWLFLNCPHGGESKQTQPTPETLPQLVILRHSRFGSFAAVVNFGFDTLGRLLAPRTLSFRLGKLP